MKYLIFARDTDKFRTKTSWVSNHSELFEGEKMLSFDKREDADRLINSGFKCCVSYGITKEHNLFKHC